MYTALTQALVAGDLSVDLLHPLDVEPDALGVVQHRLGVVHSDNAVGRLLYRFWGTPWLMDVPVGIVS